MSRRDSSIMLPSTPISAIVAGKIDFQVRVRVINLWIIPDRMKPTKDGTIQMLFLDDKCHKIQATVRKDLIPKLMDQLEEGSAYVFENFMVGSKDAFYKSIGHNKYKLNFMTSTTVFKVTAPEIPRYHFDFVPFPEILNATDESRLVDVIGHVVEKGVVKETIANGKKSKVTNLTLKDLENNRLHCSLWNDFAVRFQQFMDTHNSSEPPVMILHLVRLKKNSYLGVMGVINIFNGTKMLLNADIPDVAEYKVKMDDTERESTEGVTEITEPIILSLSDDLLQTKRMTIEDLIESSERCSGSVLVRTCDIEAALGWYYQSCTSCSSKVTITDGSIFCDKCGQPRTAVPRYKVHLQVIDSSGSTTFTLFDRIVSRVLGRSVQDLLATMNQDLTYPPELDTFVDKRMLFKVDVTDANLFRNSRSYTVRKMTEDGEIINRFMSLHALNGVDGDNVEAGCVELGSQAADKNDAVEGGDSTKDDMNTLGTPTSKNLGKRSIDSVESISDKDADGSTWSSSNKIQKLAPVKIENMD